MNLSPEEIEELRRQKQPETGDGFAMRGVSHEPEYQTVRGVTFPVEPGSSRLRLELDRKRAKKRMDADLRTVERFKAQIKASKQ